MAKAILQAAGVTRVTLGTAVTCACGDLLGWDGTQWTQAKADTRIPAQFMAMEAQLTAGGVVDVCQEGVLQDTLAPFTLGADLYLATTAGGLAALPAISATLTIMQRVGKAVATDTVTFDLAQRGPHEMRANVTYDPASLAAITARSDTATLTGLLTTDLVTRAAGSVLTGTGWDTGLIIQNMDASAANTIRFRLSNPTAGALDGASVTVPVYVDRY